MRAGSRSRRPVTLDHDSFALGLSLDEMTRGARGELGVSLCVAGDPAGASRAARRGVGLVAVRGGFEVTVGGTRRTPGCPVGHAAGEREAMEYVCGFLQLYREERRRGEGAARFVRRVDALYVRERLAKDPVGRSLLAGRFLVQTQGRVGVTAKNCSFSDKF